MGCSLETAARLQSRLQTASAQMATDHTAVFVQPASNEQEAHRKMAHVPVTIAWEDGILHTVMRIQPADRSHITLYRSVMINSYVCDYARLARMSPATAWQSGSMLAYTTAAW